VDSEWRTVFSAKSSTFSNQLHACLVRENEFSPLSLSVQQNSCSNEYCHSLIPTQSRRIPCDCDHHCRVVPSAMRGQAICHGIHRNLKHILVASCISATRESMAPFFVCSEVNDTAERRLKREGFRMNLDLVRK
jgi:hypothetical protein